MLQELHLLLVLLFHGVEVSLSLLQLVYQLLLEVDLWWGGEGRRKIRKRRGGGRGKIEGKKRLRNREKEEKEEKEQGGGGEDRNRKRTRRKRKRKRYIINRVLSMLKYGIHASVPDDSSATLDARLAASSRSPSLSLSSEESLAGMVSSSSSSEPSLTSCRVKGEGSKVRIKNQRVKLECTHLYAV